MREEAPVEEAWDLKKIILGIVVVIVLAGSLYIAKDMLGKNLTHEKRPTREVEGENTYKKDIKDDVEGKLETIKHEIQNLNAIDMATSSPQVQKIIKDLQNLQHYPSTQVKDLCQNMCKNL